MQTDRQTRLKAAGSVPIFSSIFSIFQLEISDDEVETTKGGKTASDPVKTKSATYADELDNLVNFLTT